MQMASDHCRLFFKGSLRGVDDRVDHAPAEMQAIGIRVEAHFDNQDLQQFAFVVDPFEPGFRNAIDAFNLFSNSRFIV